MTNAVIGALRVNLGIDTAQFQDGLKEANASIAQFASAAKIGLAAVVAAFSAGIGAAMRHVEQMDAASRKLDQALANSGNAARTSAKEVADWADKLERRTGRAADEVMAVGANLASFNFGNEVFFRAIELADDMSAAWGGDLRNNLEGLSRALDDPIAGFAMLRKRGISLTDAQDAMVKSLMAANDKLGAQKVVLQALESQVKGVAEAGYQGLTKSLGNLGAATSGFFDKIVQSFSGAGNMMTGVIDRITAAIDAIGDHLDVVATAAAIAGTGLAVAFAPAIFASIVAGFTMIGQAAMAAMAMINSAMLSNPFTAIVLGITAAIAALYLFRDEVQKAIGVDVIGIVKDGANLIINSFRACFEGVKVVWSQFPNIIGAAVVGAVNAVINGVNVMVKAAKTALNQVIELANKIPGVNIEGADTSKGLFDPLKNTFADELGKAVSDRNGRIAEIMASDPIGEIGKAFTASTPAVLNMNAALAATGDALDDIGGGGKGNKGGKVAKVKEQFDKVGDAIRRAQETLGKGFSGIIDGLISKSMTWKDALIQVGRELLKYLNQMNMARGGKGLFGGGLFQGLIGGLLGFAGGGTILPGGTGGIDSQLVAFRKSPNEQVDITKPGQRREKGSGTVVIQQSFPISGAISSRDVQSMVQQGAAQAVDAVKRNLPGWQVEMQHTGGLS